MADTRGPQLEAVLITLLVLSFLTVIARCYTRIVLVKIFSIEDWLAVVTFVLYLAYTTSFLIAVQHGLGSHTWDVPLEERAKAIMWRWIAVTFYITVSGLTKLIVCLFLTRVCIRQRWQKITLWLIMSVVCLYSAFYAILNINSCHPIQHEWERYAVEEVKKVDSQCNSPLLGTIPTYIAALLNVLIDWTLAILPATVLYNLKMQKRLKVTTYIVLALGSIASIATIVRLPYAKDFLVSDDYLYKFTDLGIWSTVEIGVALSASSLATLKPLFRMLRVFSSTHVSESAASGGMKYGMQRGRHSMPMMNLSGSDRRSHYAMVKITSDGKFSKTDTDFIGVQKEVSITQIV
ncbi:cation-transporting ATPase 4 [Xylariales sp. AK1849]|nr:cation-transporting ATPase 4 [Xylariales sp. AK1849]